MKQISILLILASTILSCGGNDPVNPGTDPIPSVPTPAFAKGADISWVSEMEKDGYLKLEMDSQRNMLVKML